MDGDIETLATIYVRCNSDEEFDLAVYPNPTTRPVNYAIMTDLPEIVTVLSPISLGRSLNSIRTYRFKKEPICLQQMFP